MARRRPTAAASDEAAARKAVEKLLRGRVWTESRIVDQLPSALGSRRVRLDLVRRMAAEALLFAHPPLRAGGARRYGLGPPEPRTYVPKALVGEVKSLCRRLEQVGIAPDAVFAVLRRGVEPRRRTPRTKDLGEVVLREAVRIKPSAVSGALVLLPDLWHAVRSAVADKADFDRAVMDLARDGRVDLHKHDHPPSLTPLDRTELVTDGQGSWFVGLAIRS